MGRNDEKRAVLFDIDIAIQSLRQQVADSPEIVQLT
ncbi:hypothetical protein [Thalassotalea insulae]|nr:hypothetical protein [Thalassotalea insulae]